VLKIAKEDHWKSEKVRRELLVSLWNTETVQNSKSSW